MSDPQKPDDKLKQDPVQINEEDAGESDGAVPFGPLG